MSLFLRNREETDVHMISYNSCLSLGPVVSISNYRVGVIFESRRHKNDFVCFPYELNSGVVKCYGRHGYAYYDNYAVDYYDEELDYDSDGYCSENDLLPDLDNLNSENSKSVGKTSKPMPLRAVKAATCPKREQKHANGNIHVFPMPERNLSSSVTSRADTLLLKPTSLSQNEWEMRAIKNIPQKKLKCIAMEKKKSKQAIMFKSSVPKVIRTIAESISMEKKIAVINKHDLLPDLNDLNPDNTISVEDPRSLKTFKAPSCSDKELKDVTKKTNALQKQETSPSVSVKSRANSLFLRLSLAQKQREKRAIKIQEQRLRSIAMKKMKAKQKIMLKSSVPKHVKSTSMKKKTSEQDIMHKSSRFEFGPPVGGSAAERMKAEQNVMNESVISKHAVCFPKSIAMEKKKSNKQSKLQVSKSKSVEPPMKSITMEKKKSNKKSKLQVSKSKSVELPMKSIAMEKKKSNKKSKLQVSKSKSVEPSMKSIAMEKKKSNKKSKLQVSTKSIAMKKKTIKKIVNISSKSNYVKPLTESIAVKKAEQINIPKSSKAKDVGLLTRKLISMHSRSANMDLEIEAADFEQNKVANFEQIKAANYKDIIRYYQTRQLGCEAACGPLSQYLKSMGFKESQLFQIYERDKKALNREVEAVKEKLDFLVSVGVKSEDLVKIVTKHPQILEYAIDSRLKLHIEFLQSLGIPASRLGGILRAAPSLLSYNVERSLKPKVKFLTEEVGIKRKNLGKIVALSPQILIQSVEGAMKCRLDFLSKELGASNVCLVKMVTKHPQFLRYNIKDGIEPRIKFLRSIGMNDADILKVLTRLTQILSLSVEKSLRPKYLYLVTELNNGVQSLIANPAYFSLSLEQRIWARHRFLVSLNRVPSGPFPLTALLVSDDSFCGQWANSTLEEYETFREELILSNWKMKLLQKYGKRV